MAIDPTVERIFPVYQLFEHVKVTSTTRPGKKPSRPTAWRWATKGSHGVRLETIATPSGMYTSREAFARFIERLTAARSGERPTAKPMRSPAAQKKADAYASAELTKLGL